jgi:hypothetical protein
MCLARMQHTSMANSPASDCTIKNMVDYWFNGKLPKNGTVCEAPPEWL